MRPSERGSEPAAPPPPVPPPGGERVRRGDEPSSDVLPDSELNLDGTIPPALRKLHKRLSSKVELHKLHIKHYHMSPAQFRKRTSELALPESIYRQFEQVVRECDICAKMQKPHPRSRHSGIRAQNFGDVIFMDSL